MRTPALKQIWNTLRYLSPESIRRTATRPVNVGLLTSGEHTYNAMLRFLAPDAHSSEQDGARVIRVESTQDPDRCDFGLAELGTPHPEHFYAFDPVNPRRTVARILPERQDLWLPLARHFESFRGPVMERLILQVALENGAIAVATSLPNVVPSLLQLPWAIGEFASDTALLTLNQVRLAFLLAAAGNAPVGYREQRTAISAIVAAAFGWRALAREAVSKMPLGAGVLPKGIIAFAGTYVVGLGLRHRIQTGQSLPREQERREYERAYRRGRALAGRWRNGRLQGADA